MNRRWFGAVLVGASLASCGGDAENCGNIATASVVVIVTDAQTGDRICNADVRVRVGDREFEAPSSGADCDYVSFGGQLNAQNTVTVQAEGYRPFTGTVFVPAEQCGRKPQRMYVALVKA